MLDIEQADTVQLIQLTLNGQEKAFTQLVIRHRAQAYRWAKSLTKDAFAAEDIVQNSFILAYQHLSALKDRERFLPWLKRIIHNQTVTYYRRKDSQLIPFSGLLKKEQGTRSDSNLDFSEEQALEPIQFFLNRSAIEDPDKVTVHKEDADKTKALFKKLSPHAQKMAEAFFIQEQTAEVISSLFQRKPSQVYNTISKAKKRLQDLHFQQEVGLFIQARKGRRNVSSPAPKHEALCEGTIGESRLMLPVPKQTSSYTSMAHVMYQLFQYLGAPYSLTEVMGFSGQAFRLQVARNGDPVGIFLFEWGKVWQQALDSLGLCSSFVGNPSLRRLTPEPVLDAIELIQMSLLQGIPALAWNLTRAEFSLIYGYDDQKQQFTYRDVAQTGQTIAYERLGRHTSQTHLFVAVLKGTVEHYPLYFDKTFTPSEVEAPSTSKVNPVQDFHKKDVTLECLPFVKPLKWKRWLGPSLIQAFKGVVDHLKGEEKKADGYVGGLEAYHAWITALKTNTMTPSAHAYLVALVSEERYHALEFLQRMKGEKVFLSPSKHERYKQHMQKLTQIYEQVYQTLMEIYPSFPYSLSFSNAEKMKELISALLFCRSLEHEGILHLERIISLAEEQS